MQSITTTVENIIDDNIEKHKQAYGHIREMLDLQIRRDYETYHSYVRNVPSLITPKYNKITTYVNENIAPLPQFDNDRS